MKEYTVKRANDPVPLEGNPEGAVWEAADKGSMLDAVSGEEPKLATDFRMLYDDDNLYIGYAVKDDIIVAEFTEHDSPLYQEDVVEIFFSPTGSINFYYEFNFSPKAVVFDAVVLNDDGRAGSGRGELFAPLTAWDCEGLQLKVQREADNDWSVTVAMPFRQLHLAGNKAPVSGDAWRANLFRIEYGGGKEEYSAWSPPGIGDFHTSENFGIIIFE